MALALAAQWPSRVDGGVRPVMVEADASGGDLMIRFGLPTAPSLLDVAAAAGKPQPGSLLGAACELPFGLRAVVSVPGRGSCREAVRLLAGEAGRRVLLGDDHDRGTVLLDVGRLTEDVAPLLDAADQMVLVARGGAEPLTHVSSCGLDVGEFASRLTLAVVGPCPYPAKEIRESLGIERVHRVPWDARSVAAMSNRKNRALRASGFRPPPLMTAARTLSRQLAGPTQSGTGTGDAVVDRGFVSDGTRLVRRSRRDQVRVPGVEESGS
ncbi:hypothetical protein [Streptomyces sp. 35G-GA-8]|uniref:MinD/ParA family ATP-binding protein n=1 Tax=Streptomyces sp. 35G-GA-8 TaxID=2939434 RepID=UPI00201F7468|nr:hypothetical protein [Streptomyces sp. 35G-GA-8]MCL7377020.1 hypothetical protein [Streptomyces sp. 35G-GA-8]